MQVNSYWIMANARYEFGVCSACRKKIDVWASKCPWCHSELEAIIKTHGQYQFVKWSMIIGGILGAFIVWYWLGGGDKAFKKGEIEGVVHLYPSEKYVNSHKRNIKEVVFKKTYEFESSSDEVKFAKNAFPVRSKCFEEVFKVSFQKFQKYYDSLSVRNNQDITKSLDQLISEKAIINKKNGKEKVNYRSWSNLNNPVGEYDWEFYSYIPYNQLTKYPNIRIYCRYKDAIHRNLR